MSNPLKDLSDDEIVEKSRLQLGGGSSIFSGQLDPAYPVEMMRRLKDSIDSFNTITTRFSKILIFLTILMVIIAFIQTWQFMR